MDPVNDMSSKPIVESSLMVDETKINPYDVKEKDISYVMNDTSTSVNSDAIENDAHTYDKTRENISEIRRGCDIDIDKPSKNNNNSDEGTLNFPSSIDTKATREECSKPKENKPVVEEFSRKNKNNVDEYNQKNETISNRISQQNLLDRNEKKRDNISIVKEKIEKRIKVRYRENEKSPIKERIKQSIRTRSKSPRRRHENVRHRTNVTEKFKFKDNSSKYDFNVRRSRSKSKSYSHSNIRPSSRPRNTSKYHSGHRSRSRRRSGSRPRSRHKSRSYSNNTSHLRVNRQNSGYYHCRNPVNKTEQNLRSDIHIEKSYQHDDSNVHHESNENIHLSAGNQDTSNDKKPNKQLSRKDNDSSLHSGIDPNFNTCSQQKPISPDIVKSYSYSVRIPQYLEEEHLLRKKISIKINQYLSNPESHPQYNQQLSRFISSKFNIAGELSEDDLNENQKDEWMESWQQIIKCKYEETFRNERRFLLLQHDVDFADVEKYRNQQDFERRLQTNIMPRSVNPDNTTNLRSTNENCKELTKLSKAMEIKPKISVNTKLQNDLYKKARKRLKHFIDSSSDHHIPDNIHINHSNWNQEIEMHPGCKELFDAYEDTVRDSQGGPNTVSQEGSAQEDLDWGNIHKALEMARKNE